MRSACLALCLLGCDVYSPSFLDASTPPTEGCRRGTADCDRDGVCESDLDDDPRTCGACDNACEGAQTCVEGRCIGDAGMPMDGGPDAGMDGGTDGGGVDSGPSICGRVWPPRPPLSTEGSDLSTFTYALRDIIVDQRAPVWGSIGWNIDERCTVSPSDEHLCVPPGRGAPPIDGPGGVDNSFGENLLGLIAENNSTFEVDAREDELRGEVLIVRLAGWNGNDEDPRVEVTLAASVDVQRLDGSPIPLWDGNDRWNVSDTSYRDGNPDRPLIRDDNAYVSDRIFVAKLPDRQDIVIPWAGGNQLALRLTDVRLTGVIDDSGNNLEDVWLTGRFAAIDLNAVWDLSGICDGTPIRDLIEDEVAEDMDVRSSPGSGGPGVSCDAMSLAISWSGVRGDFGSVVPAPPADPPECL